MDELENINVLDYIGRFLAEDIGRGDITTQSTVPKEVKGIGSFLAKEDMVVCGMKLAEKVFRHLDSENLEIISKVSDGDEVESGAVFGTIEGFADVLLAGERLALNLVQRMSGIATLSKQYAKAVEGTNTIIVDTRKTTPGLRMLEKYAVTVGGCKNHRYGLDDGVLIKDNHIELAGGVKEAVRSAKEKVGHLHKIEVEVKNWAELQEAIQAGADIVMLDNQTPEETKKLVEIARNMDPNVLIEASGGIGENTVRSYAESGVDLISVGRLTHSARAMDISFNIKML